MNQDIISDMVKCIKTSYVYGIYSYCIISIKPLTEIMLTGFQLDP